MWPGIDSFCAAVVFGGDVNPRHEGHGGPKHGNIWRARSGNQGGLEHFLLVLITFGVQGGCISLEGIALTRIGFGVNFMPTAPVPQVVEWAKAVERHGYDLLGISDSQSISRDVYVTLAHCATATAQVRFGPRVITPVTRHPAVAASAAATLAELAPGRTLIGIGSGDSAA